MNITVERISTECILDIFHISNRFRNLLLNALRLTLLLRGQRTDPFRRRRCRGYRELRLYLGDMGREGFVGESVEKADGGAAGCDSTGLEGCCFEGFKGVELT